MCSLLDYAENKGISKGISEGIGQGKIEDARLAAGDEAMRKRFYSEYGLER